jgi:hypothetical protein
MNLKKKKIKFICLSIEFKTIFGYKRKQMLPIRKILFVPSVDGEMERVRWKISRRFALRHGSRTVNVAVYYTKKGSV